MFFETGIILKEVGLLAHPRVPRNEVFKRKNYDSEMGNIGKKDLWVS